jgi:hypothetical protein
MAEQLETRRSMLNKNQHQAPKTSTQLDFCHTMVRHDAPASCNFGAMFAHPT